MVLIEEFLCHGGHWGVVSVNYTSYVGVISLNKLLFTLYFVSLIFFVYWQADFFSLGLIMKTPSPL